MSLHLGIELFLLAVHGGNSSSTVCVNAPKEYPQQKNGVGFRLSVIVILQLAHVHASIVVKWEVAKSMAYESLLLNGVLYFHMKPMSEILGWVSDSMTTCLWSSYIHDSDWHFILGFRLHCKSCAFQFLVLMQQRRTESCSLLASTQVIYFAILYENSERKGAEDFQLGACFWREGLTCFSDSILQLAWSATGLDNSDYWELTVDHGWYFSFCFIWLHPSQVECNMTEGNKSSVLELLLKSEVPVQSLVGTRCGRKQRSKTSVLVKVIKLPCALACEPLNGTENFQLDFMCGCKVLLLVGVAMDMKLQVHLTNLTARGTILLVIVKKCCKYYRCGDILVHHGFRSFAYWSTDSAHEHWCWRQKFLRNGMNQLPKFQYVVKQLSSHTSDGLDQAQHLILYTLPYMMVVSFSQFGELSLSSDGWFSQHEKLPYLPPVQKNFEWQFLELYFSSFITGAPSFGQQAMLREVLWLGSSLMYLVNCIAFKAIKWKVQHYLYSERELQLDGKKLLEHALWLEFPVHKLAF